MSESTLNNLLCMDVAPNSLVEVSHESGRRKRRTLYSVWMLQGVNYEDAQQIHIADWEIDAWIDALQKAKIAIAEHKDT